MCVDRRLSTVLLQTKLISHLFHDCADLKCFEPSSIRFNDDNHVLNKHNVASCLSYIYHTLNTKYYSMADNSTYRFHVPAARNNETLKTIAKLI